MSDFPTPEELKGTVQGTLLYLSLYLFFLIPFQSASKYLILKQKKMEAKNKKSDDGDNNNNKTKKVSFRAIKYYNSTDLLALRGDRAVGNFLEFSILFIPLLWMHAVFVDPTQSLQLSTIYTAARALYPFLFGGRAIGGAVPAVLLSTLPGYLVLGYLMSQITLKFALV